MRPRSLTEVAAFGLCTGCGLCAGMASGGVLGTCRRLARGANRESLPL